MSEYLSHNIEHISYKEVAELDPLNVDTVMQYLPELNATEDVEALRLATLTAVYTSEQIDSYTKPEAYAAMRDLDFLASSLIRHGDNPIDTIEGLEAQLLRLRENTDTIPRGTVFTYAAANPAGERRRSFTGSEAEDSFIEAVAQSIYSLDSSVDSLSCTSYSIDDEPALVQALLNTEVSMQQMVKSIVSVKRTVSPEFFTNNMRPYFDGMTIDGKKYTGAGGAQIQLLALDYMLWGCADESEDYRQFYDENYQYLTPAQQEAICNFTRLNGTKSIVEHVSDTEGVDQFTKEATLNVLKAIKKFRYPHRRIAQENFELRSKEAVGSGNYRPDILDTLLDKINDSIRRIEGGV